MISIIICSNNQDLFQKVARNISKTIGIVYEIIRIDNKDNKYSICQAYNIGIEKSSYNFLCFCHEDILIKTEGWGSKVISHLTDKEIGMIGLVGNNIQSSLPGPMWTQVSMNKVYMNYYQRYYFDGNVGSDDSSIHNYTVEHRCYNPGNELSHRVEVIDGFWFCVAKESLRDIKFDTLNFSGFHYYDIDISLQIGIFKKNYVVFDIDVEHFSNGSLSFSWIQDSIKLVEKWKYSLPVFSNHYNYEELKRYDIAVFFNFCLICSQKNMSDLFIRNTIVKYFKLNWLLILNKFTIAMLLWFVQPSIAYKLFRHFVNIKSNLNAKE